MVWIDVAIMCDLVLYDMNDLMLVLSIYFNSCLCVKSALSSLIFLAYQLVVVMGTGFGVMLCGGFEWAFCVVVVLG